MSAWTLGTLVGLGLGLIIFVVVLISKLKR